MSDIDEKPLHVVDAAIEEAETKKKPRGARRGGKVTGYLASGLTDKEEAFCQAYVRLGGDGLAAVHEAGFSNSNISNAKVTVWRLLKREDVLKRINVLRNKAATRNDITVDDIVTNLKEVFQAALNEGKFADANKSMELLGKFLGMFDEKGAKPGQNSVRNKSPEEIDQEIHRLAGITGKMVPGVEGKA